MIFAQLLAFVCFIYMFYQAWCLFVESTIGKIYYSDCVRESMEKCGYMFMDKYKWLEKTQGTIEAEKYRIEQEKIWSDINDPTPLELERERRREMIERDIDRQRQIEEYKRVQMIWNEIMNWDKK